MSAIAQHSTILAIAGFWVFSAIVGGMTALTESSSPGYVWLYNSLHILAGNLTTAMQAKFPTMPAGSFVQQTRTTTVVTPETPETPKG